MKDEVQALQKALQRDKLQSFRRRVPVGDLLTDRWENAAEYGFGSGSSMYDSALVLGDVEVGEQTWIGPNVVLDGLGSPLRIGSFCAVSAGVQIYTHDTVRWCVSLGKGPKMDTAPTVVGDGVYIGPNCVIAKGVTIGDRCVIGAMSFVDRDIPAGKKAWGCPARVVADVDG